MTVTTAVRSPANTLLKLRAAARLLFVRDGYHATRPQDIARQAGVASGTFYLHFKDKRVAFMDFANEAQAELIECFRENLDGVLDHRERWRIVVETVINFGSEHPGLLTAAFMDPVLIAPEDDEAWQIYDRLGHFVDMALQESAAEVAAQYDLQLVSHGICGLLRHAMTYAGRKNIDRKKLIDEVSLFIDRGLGI